MMWKCLPIILFFWYPATADYLCVCSNHISANIYKTADTHTQPIGTLYPDAGECKPAYNDTSHPKFVAVIHFHEIGYLVRDKDIRVTNCAGHPDNENILTTSFPPVSPMVSTLLSTTLPASTNTSTRGCNKIALFMDIARGKNVGTSTSHHCADNVSFGADAVISTFCGAPTNQRWMKGRKVVDFAGTIMKYSPIGRFHTDGKYNGYAGVYLGYINSTIYMVSQNCNTGLNIHGIDAFSSPLPQNQYHEITW